MRHLWTWTLIIGLVGSLATATRAVAANFVVYSVYQSLDMGNPGEVPLRDYYVNMGSSNGVREGMVLQVIRKVSTYDLLSEKLYRDVEFPIATLKVIHVESNAAIARLDQMLPVDKTPAVANRAVMVGDIVKIAE